MRKVKGRHTYHPSEVLEGIAVPIEKSVFEKTGTGKVIHSSFRWQDIGSLEDLSMTGIQRDDRNQIVYESTNTTVLN